MKDLKILFYADVTFCKIEVKGVKSHIEKNIKRIMMVSYSKYGRNNSKRFCCINAFSSNRSSSVIKL